MSVTVICGFKANKRARYCNRSFVNRTFTGAVMDFSLHCVAEHEGKMVGEILNAKGKRFSVTEATKKEIESVVKPRKPKEKEQ